MGYRKEAKVYRLVWDPSTDYSGLEVCMKSVPIGEFLKIAELKAMEDRDDRDIAEMFEIFAKALKSWNLEEEDGTPVPATLAGVYEQELDFILAIVMRWAGALAGVTESLGKDSTSGVTFPEASLPMDPLSNARLSLTGQN